MTELFAQKNAVVNWIPFFFFNDTATTEIYTLSLHDALPISDYRVRHAAGAAAHEADRRGVRRRDRKSTRLNSSHMSISYAVFCLKKKIRTKKDGGTSSGGPFNTYASTINALCMMRDACTCSS